MCSKEEEKDRDEDDGWPRVGFTRRLEDGLDGAAADAETATDDGAVAAAVVAFVVALFVGGPPRSMQEAMVVNTIGRINLYDYALMYLFC